MASSHMERC